VNHSKDASCWWRVRGDLTRGSGCIELRCGLWSFPSAGEELCIRYQEDASNTSMLLRYGFVEGHNHADRLRVSVPWDRTSPESKRSKQLDLLKVRPKIFV
jgi:hypothetical protein